MKTPEEVAREIGESTLKQWCCGHPQGYGDQQECCGSPMHAFEFTSDTEALIAAALAERDRRADALAEALRVADDMIANCAGVPNNPDSLPRMLQAHFRAALAAYDAEAK